MGPILVQGVAGLVKLEISLTLNFDRTARDGVMIRNGLLVTFLFFFSCVSIAQDDLEFVDETDSIDAELDAASGGSDVDDIKGSAKEEFGEAADEDLDTDLDASADSDDLDLDDDKKSETETEEEFAEDAIEEDDLDSEVAEENEAPADDLEEDLEAELDEEEVKEETPEEKQVDTAEPAPPQEEAPVAEPVFEEVSPGPVVNEEPLAPPPPNNDPNLDLESRLGFIFQKYSDKMSDEEWVKIAGDKQSESYAVQAGDTLWDISVTFFGTGHFWPKLWQLNDEITNPHLIYPGRVLKFNPGSVAEPPTLEVADSEGPTDAPADLEEPAGEEVLAEDSIPDPPPVPPAPTRKATLRALPPSLPFIGDEDDGFDEDGFALDSTPPGISEAVVRLENYISEVDPVSIGKVVDVESWDKVATQYQSVYIESSEIKVGDRLMSFKIGGKIEDPETGDNMGREISIGAEVVVTGRLKGEGSIYKADVVLAISPIEVGSFVVKGNIPGADISPSGNSKSVSSRVIGGRFDSKRRFLGTFGILYLDQGSSSGLQSGDILSVLRNNKLRKPDSPANGDSIPIAQIKIIKSTPQRSTALVLSSRDAIRPGDYTGSFELARVSNPTSSGGDSGDDLGESESLDDEEIDSLEEEEDGIDEELESFE
jgi:hypothetical protein